LHKEFRLFNALVKTGAATEHVADVILAEARELARRLDLTKLDEEKTVLIRHINKTFSRDEFYSRRIPDYKVYATIQTLINDWRDPDSDIVRKAKYEEQVRQRLTQECVAPVDVSGQVNKDVDPLVLKIMFEKVNSKLRSELSPEQRSIVNAYVSDSDSQELKTMLEDVKRTLVKDLKDYSDAEGNQIITEKVERVVSDVSSLDTQVLTDETISKFMTVVALRDAIREEE
jgi:hypothetical protein